MFTSRLFHFGCRFCYLFRSEFALQFSFFATVISLSISSYLSARSLLLFICRLPGYFISFLYLLPPSSLRLSFFFVVVSFRWPFYYLSARNYRLLWLRQLAYSLSVIGSFGRTLACGARHFELWLRYHSVCRLTRAWDKEHSAGRRYIPLSFFLSSCEVYISSSSFVDGDCQGTNPDDPLFSV